MGNTRNPYVVIALTIYALKAFKFKNDKIKNVFEWKCNYYQINRCTCSKFVQ